MPKGKPGTLTHGASAYRRGACRCAEICQPAHAARVADETARRRARFAPDGLQLDVLTTAQRLAQLDREIGRNGITRLGELLLHRLINVDLPRLRSHLTPATLLWEANTAAELVARLDAGGQDDAAGPA